MNAKFPTLPIEERLMSERGINLWLTPSHQRIAVHECRVSMNSCPVPT